MIVKKYGIYKMKSDVAVGGLNPTVQNYSNTVGFEFSFINKEVNNFEFVSRESLAFDRVKYKYVDDFFDNENEIFEIMEHNLFSYDYTDLVVLPVLKQITDIQEIRRLKIKGILSDDTPE